MNYLFYNYYKLFRRKGTYTSFQFAACNLFFIFCFFNLIAISLLARIIGLFDIFKIGSQYLIGFCILLMLLIILYFNRKKIFHPIIERYDKIPKRWSFYVPFWIYVTISFFLPLFLLAYAWPIRTAPNSVYKPLLAVGLRRLVLLVTLSYLDHKALLQRNGSYTQALGVMLN